MIEKIKSFINSFGVYEMGGLLSFWYWDLNGNTSRSFYIPIPLWFRRTIEGLSMILFGQTYVLITPTKESRTLGFYYLDLLPVEDPFDISTHYVYLNPDELTSSFTEEEYISSSLTVHRIQRKRMCFINFVDDYLAFSPDKVEALTQ